MDAVSPSIACAVLLAVCLVHRLPTLPVLPLPTALAIGTVTAVLVLAAGWRWRRRRAAGALLGGVAMVVWVVLAAGVRLDGRLPVSQHGMSVRALAQVVGVPVQRADRCELMMDTLALNGRRQRLRLQVRWYGELACEPLEPGSRWSLVLRVGLPRANANPGISSRERRWFRAHIDGRAWVRAEQPHEQVAGPEGRAAVARLRRALAERLGAALPPSLSEAYPLLAALTLGLGKPFEPSVRETLTITGTGHLFAISGLHIGLLSGLCLVLSRVGCSFGVRPAPARGPLLFALLAACAYALLAGFTVPTQRALLGLAVVLGARCLGRQASAPRALALALLGVLILDPLAPLDEGFWLSFLAVTCLVLGRVEATVTRSWVMAQLRLGLGLLPLGVSVFSQISLIAPVANLLVVPIFAVAIVPISLIGVLAAAVSPSLASWPLWLAGQCLLAVLGGLKWLGTSPMIRLEVAHRPALWALLLAQAGVLLLLAHGLPGRRLGGLLCTRLFMSILVQTRPAALPSDVVRVTLLDVGQGMASVVETRDHVMLYDAGPAYFGGGSAGAAVVAPFLAGRGVRSLDRIVLSHGDSDHAGGLGDVLRFYPGTPVLAGGADTPWPACRAGQGWEWNGVRFAVLHPASSGWKGNDGSCVLRIAVGEETRERSVLLTGDIQSRAEAHLLQQATSALDVDVLLAPHHGSASSSTSAFVGATTPEHVLFACGYANRWNFPRQSVRARWTRAGAAIHVTASDGALTVTLRPGEVSRVSGERRRGRRYWSVP
ncbi:MAG: DNA internalization-related competence protein ComEC/Rec2 [Pseudomonadota bacterium]